MSSIRRPLWAMNAAAAVALAVALAVGLGVGVGVAEAQGSAPVSCDAKMGSLLASDDFVDFTSAVKGANLEHIALVEALMEDPEVEVGSCFCPCWNRSGVASARDVVQSRRSLCLGCCFCVQQNCRRSLLFGCNT